MPFASWLERALLRHGVALLAVVAVISAFLGLGYARLRWTSDPEVITLEGSDELEFYRQYVARWGSDKWIVLAYPVADAFAPESLRLLRELTNALTELPGVVTVESLDTAVALETGPFGPYLRPLVPDEIDGDPGLREAALANGFVRDQLVSNDGTLVLLAAQLDASGLDSSAQERRVLDGLESLLSRAPFAKLDVRLAGSPVFNRELERLNRRDNALFTPLVVVLIAGTLALLFRSALATAVATGAIGLTVLWTLGLMGWLGVPMNITTSLLPPLLLVVSVAYAIHVISGYVERLGQGESRAGALRWTLAEMLPSCFWTAATTAIGFGSLLLVRIESVRVFGTFAVAGVAFAYLHCALVVPALLVRLPFEGVAERRAELRWLRFVRAGARRPRVALAFLAAVIALGAWAAPRVEVATHDGEFFRPENPINRAYRLIESRVGGVTPFEVELRAAAPGAFRTPEGARALEAVQRRLSRVPELSAGTSLVDLLRASAPALELADDAAVTRELFVLAALEPREVGRFVKDDGQRARVSARARAMTSARSEAILAELRADAPGLVPPGWQVRFTGLVPVFAQMEQYLVVGQLASYGSAILSIGLVFFLLHRSLSLTALALLVNVAPIGPTAALMVVLGMRLDVATIMVASIALGIVVDDTIHMLHAWRRGLELRGDADGALEYALGVAGRPTILTALILIAGFGVLAASDFQPTAHFGALVAFTVAMSLAVELVVMPPALRWLAPRFLAARPNPETAF